VIGEPRNSFLRLAVQNTGMVVSRAHVSQLKRCYIIFVLYFYLVVFFLMCHWFYVFYVCTRFLEPRSVREAVGVGEPEWSCTSSQEDEQCGSSTSTNTAPPAPSPSRRTLHWPQGRLWEQTSPARRRRRLTGTPTWSWHGRRGNSVVSWWRV